MNHRQKNQRISFLEVENWNLLHDVGTPVLLTKDSGETIITKTRSHAEIASSGHAVIWLDGVLGFYLLNRVKAR